MTDRATPNDREPEGDLQTVDEARVAECQGVVIDGEAALADLDGELRWTAQLVLVEAEVERCYKGVDRSQYDDKGGRER